MLLKRKEFCVRPFLNKGSILITVIIIMLIFSVLAVIMLSLTGTSIFSQLNTSSTTRATYIAKSGYNYLASVYKNTAPVVGQTTEAAKNQALENINNVNFQLLNNNGSFLLNVEPSYFRATTSDANLRSGDSFSFKFPGAETYKFTVNQTGTMAVYMGATYGWFNYSITAAAANNYTLTLTTRPKRADTLTSTNLTTAVVGSPSGGGTSIVPVLTPANTQTLISGGNLTVATGTGTNFPARFGFFEIPLVTALRSYVFYYDHRTGDTFYGIRDANSPNTAFPSTTNNITTSTLIYAHTSAAITSAGTFQGPGPAVSNTFSRTAILGYTPGGNSSAVPAPQDIPGVDGWITIGTGIGLNTSAETISIGGGSTNTAGVAWYAGNSDAAECAAGTCTFGTGVRAYFTFRDSNGSASSGDGFMFIIMNGILNDTTKRGGTVSGSGMGELMGYAGPGNTSDGLGLQPPKLAIEFDRYVNANVNSAGCLNGRNDATTGTTNHMALMFWGDNTAGDCGTGSPIANLPAVSADDNVHSAGVAAYPTAGYNTTPSNSSSTDGLGGYYATAFSNTNTRVFRIEVTRYVTPNTNWNYNYNVKAWIDCTACDDLSVPYSGASTVRINRTIELSPDLHTDFNKMVFGFTQGTGSATQNITINNFDIFFPGSCNYIVNPISLTVPRAASTGSIALSMSGSCSWTATSDSAWLTIPLASQAGAGSGTITYNYTLNGGAARTGTITVTSPAGPQTFTLTQTNP